MSYTGGIAFSVDNRRDNELSSCIQRAEDMERIKADIMPMGYTGRIQANSSANYARNYYGQLPNVGVNTRDSSLLQYKGFKDDVIDASSREMQSASRFNYAFDRQINKRFIDVSGQMIPNNKLRVLPNRGCAMYGKQPAPYTDPDLQQLSESLMRESINKTLAYNPADANSYMKFKATRPRLTRQDLMEASQQYAIRFGAGAGTTATVAAVAAAATAVNQSVPNSARSTSGLSARTTQIIEEVRRRRNDLNVAIPIPREMQVGGLP